MMLVAPRCSSSASARSSARYAAITYAAGHAGAARSSTSGCSTSRRTLDASRTNESVVKQEAQGPLPVVDRLMSRTDAGAGLKQLIEQSGVQDDARRDRG